MSDQPYVFVSYASRDRERVLPIVDRLSAAGVGVWIDREGIHGGANYALEIAEAIEQAAAIALMCSAASLASRNVKQELALGWRFERPYLPLLLETVEIPKDVAYWLEGSQWIELLDRPASAWLTDLSQALAPLGISLRLPEATTAPAAGRARPLLVGREREQGLLRGQLDRMLGGHGGVVLVGGEAGIGKTTLVEDLSVQAEEQGALVLWGHAYDLSVTPPYGPWLEILRQYRSLAAADLPPVPPFVFDTAELAKVGSQETLFTTMTGFFTTLAARRPLLLVLDDLQWDDQASLDFLRHLARQLAGQRVLLLATYRSDEVTRRHPLAALLPLLVREAGAERVDVQPIQQAGRRALIRSRYALGEADQTRLERYLEEHAEGNPLYAGELLRTLEEEGVLTQQAGDWTLGNLEQVRLPALLRQVIEGRLARLDEECQRLLGVAAVVGQVVPLAVWAAAGGVDEDTLLDHAERAEEARLLEGLPAGDGVRFSHALIREALYDGIPSLRRRRLHQRIGEVLSAAPHPDPDIVAYHLQRAGDPRAIDWLLQAAERAWSVYAPAAAIAHFDQAEALAEPQGRALPASAYLIRGQAQRLVGNFAPARDDLEQALTLARQAGDGRTEWQALTELGMLWTARDYAKTGEYFRQALALARTLDAPDLTAHALNRVGNWHVNVEELLEGVQNHREALAIFERLDDRAGLAGTYDLLALGCFLSGDLTQGGDYLRHAVALFRASGDRAGLASCLSLVTMQGVNNLTETVFIEQETVAARLSASEEAFAIAHAMGWRVGEAYALWTRAFCLGASGAYGAALDAVQRSLEIAEEIDHQQWLSAAHAAAGAIYFDLLALPQAQHHYEQSFSFARQNASTTWMYAASGLVASVLLAGGDRAGAEAALDAILDPDTPMYSLPQRRLWVTRVELVLAQGDPEAALGLLDRMAAANPSATHSQPTLYDGLLRARARAALGEYEAAQAALVAIQGVAQALEARSWSWRIYLERGKVYAQQERHEQAAAQFAAARAIIDELAAGTPDELRPTFLEQAARLFPAP